MNVILSLHISACLFMTGVIWIVQVLVYPNFRNITDLNFSQIHHFHTQRISWVVVPAMILELTTACLLLWIKFDLFYLWNLISIFVIWCLTFFVSVPLHHSLGELKMKSKDLLIWTNWPRTILWSLRSVGLIWFVNKILGGGSI